MLHANTYVSRRRSATSTALGERSACTVRSYGRLTTTGPDKAALARRRGRFGRFLIDALNAESAAATTASAARRDRDHGERSRTARALRRRPHPLAQRRELVPAARVGDVVGRQPGAPRGCDAPADVVHRV